MAIDLSALEVNFEDAPPYWILRVYSEGLPHCYGPTEDVEWLQRAMARLRTDPDMEGAIMTIEPLYPPGDLEYGT